MSDETVKVSFGPAVKIPEELEEVIFGKPVADLLKEQRKRPFVPMVVEYQFCDDCPNTIDILLENKK